MSDAEVGTEIEAARGVPVLIGGKERRLVLSFNALAAMEEVTGTNMLLYDRWTKPNATVFRAGLWAGLLHEAPDLTVEQVGEWIDEVGAASLIGPFIRAYLASMPKSEKSEGKKSRGEEGPDARPRRRVSRG